MGIKLIKKTNEAEYKKFDSSMVAEDEKKFDFTGLHERLNIEFILPAESKKIRSIYNELME